MTRDEAILALRSVGHKIRRVGLRMHLLDGERRSTFQLIKLAKRLNDNNFESRSHETMAL